MTYELLLMCALTCGFVAFYNLGDARGYKRGFEAGQREYEKMMR